MTTEQGEVKEAKLLYIQTCRVCDTLLCTPVPSNLLLVAQLPEVKNFIYGDFESKYDRTVFKKIPGKAPEVIFYTQSGKELERLNIEKFDRYDAYAFVAFSVVRVFSGTLLTTLTFDHYREELNKMMAAKGIPLKAKGHDEV